jgi:hypothetical protein
MNFNSKRNSSSINKSAEQVQMEAERRSQPSIVSERQGKDTEGNINKTGGRVRGNPQAR